MLPAVLLAALVSALVAGQTVFPKALRVHVGSWFERQYEKFVASGTWLYEPLAKQLTAVFDGLLDSMTLMAAPVIVALVVGIVTVLRGFRLGLLSVALFAWVLLTDLWQPTLETFAFMLVAVILSAVAGLTLGIVGSLSSRLDTAVRLLVDVMQAFPSFAYMVPAIVLLGIGNSAALVVTIIWAAPPLARMTSVGLRGVSPDTVEAAVATGASRSRILFGVKLPMAAQSLQAGFNQTSCTPSPWRPWRP